MAHAEPNARQRILLAASEVLRESNDERQVTARRIAQRAGVGVGLINYHFRNRQELLREAVATALSEEVGQATKAVSGLGGNPVVRIKTMLKELARIAERHPLLAQIAASHEIRSGCHATTERLVPLLREMYGAARDDGELRLIALQIAAPLYVLFLHAPTFAARSGPDIADRAQREQVVNSAVDNVVLGTRWR